jgi:HK97 family phage prohead protease
MTTLFKQFATEIKAVADTRTIKFLISTDAIDRDGDSIDPKGWDLTNYMKSPVVLWSHDYSQPPVAKATSIESTKNGLAATAEFPAKGVYPFADTVYELLKGGFLSASSVGFRPIDGAPAEGSIGMNYSKQELLEFSVVPVPANPEALVQMSIDRPECKGLAKPLVDWSEKFLAEYYGERGVWLPASQVEKTFEVIQKSGLMAHKITQAETDRLIGISGQDGALTPAPAITLPAADAETPAEDMAEPAEEPNESSSCLEIENEHETIRITMNTQTDLVLELTDDLVEVELEDVQAGIFACVGKYSADEAVRQVNYMRGRVV